jgi:hypothetical protein
MLVMNLHDLIEILTVEEREALAKKVPTDPGYLWQLARQWRGKKPSLGLMQKLVAADPRLTLGELVEEFAGTRSDGGPAAEHAVSPSPTAQKSGRREPRHRDGPSKSAGDKPSNRKGR